MFLDDGSDEGENAQESKDDGQKKKKSKSKKEISLGIFKILSFPSFICYKLILLLIMVLCLKLINKYIYCNLKFKQILMFSLNGSCKIYNLNFDFKVIIILNFLYLFSYYVLIIYYFFFHK